MRSRHPERAVAARKRESDLMRELGEAWTVLGEQGRTEFREAACAVLEGIENRGVFKPSGATRRYP